MGQTQSLTSTRIDWVDSLKGFGMLLVVLSHTAIDHDTNRILYAFHMPLFFLISGLLFSPHKYDSLRALAKKRTQTLLVPYVFYALGSWVLWANVARHYGADADSGLSVLTPLLGIVYSVGSENWLVPNCPLWFLTCLFVTECIYWTLHRITSSKFQCGLLMIACGALGNVLSNHLAIRLPWGMDVAFTAVTFYGAGHLLKPFIFECMSSTLFSPLKVATVVVVGAFGVAIADGQVDMSRNILGNGALSFYVPAVSGIVSSFALIRLLGSMHVLSFVGRNTLPILALQLPALGVVKAVQLFVFQIPLASSDLSLTLGICQAAGIIAVVIPLTAVIDRWFPFLAGKPGRHITEKPYRAPITATA